MVCTQNSASIITIIFSYYAESSRAVFTLSACLKYWPVAQLSSTETAKEKSMSCLCVTQGEREYS